MKKVARGIAALLILALLLIGAPVALLAWVGNPWPPGGLAEVQLLTSRAVMGLIAVIAWAAWAQMSACILIETVAAIRGIDASRITFATGSQQQLARILVTSVAALGLGASTATSAPDAQATAPPQAVNATAHVHHTQQAQHGPRDEARAQGNQIDVEVPSTLWKLAEAHTGDGTRWRELLDLNRGARLPDGTTLTSSTQTIPAGTTITIPAGAHSQAADRSEKAGRGGRTHQNNEKSYTVKTGDTLWDISEEKLGDPTRYPELFDASRDTIQPGGKRLIDPDHIEPGWDITIPAQKGTTSPPGSKPAQAGETQQVRPDKAAPHESTEKADQNKERAGQQDDRTDARREEQAAGSVQPGRSRPDAAEQTPRVHPGDHPNGRATGRADTADDAAQNSAESWLLAGLTGGGVLLAGALLIGLQERRRRQSRARRPGRAIPTPDPEVAPVEKSIIAIGSTTSATVAWLDEALRRLAARAHETHTAMPPVAAVELHEDTVTLHLSAEAHLPAPWEGTPDRLHWHCTTNLEADDLGPPTGWVEAPYPLLVTIGHTDDGVMWLLNCEELGSLCITGDLSRGRDLARHLAAQLAVNPWSRQVDIDCIGIAEETTQLSDRIHHHTLGPEADVAVEDALAATLGTLKRAQAHDTDTSTGRTGQIDEDVWPARMLLLDASHAPDQLSDLLTMIAGQPGRTGTSIVLAGDHAAAMTLRVTPSGRVHLEHQGLDLAAVGLTADEAHGCALLYAQRNNLEDTEVPVDVDVEGPASHSDRTGALRPEHTRPRATTQEEAGEPLTSLLELDDAEYTRAAPVTPEDLQALAPRVPASVRTKVEADDPTLDDDVAAWFDPDSRRPKLAVLGKIKVTAHGKPLATAKAYCTEVLAYLATEDHRKNGVTRDQVARAFLLDDPAQVRKYLNMVRGWLGTNPNTGQPHLPNADQSPASKKRGTYVYQLDDGLLVDMDLFRRLRQRAMARGGTEGHRDLSRALKLVSGRPFDGQRPNGWSWLVDTGDEHHMTAMIADTALTVCTRCLADTDLHHARKAAEIAALAAPYEETTQMALACVNGAEGNVDEAARILRDEIYNRVDEPDVPPADLSERTRTILNNQDWLAS